MRPSLDKFVRYGVHADGHGQQFGLSGNLYGQVVRHQVAAVPAALPSR